MDEECQKVVGQEALMSRLKFVYRAFVKAGGVL